MPDIVEPTIPQYPEQGIQATLDLLYLWNPDVIQPYIEEFERLVEEMRELLENLPEVAITGSYDDLTDKPAIDGVILTKNTTKEELGLDIDLSAYRTAADQDVIDDRLERLIEGVDDGLTALENVVATKASQAALQEAITNLTGQIDTKASKAELEAGLATKQDIIQFEVMPAATAENFGDVIQYVGATNGLHTKGYIYENKSNTTYIGVIGFEPAKIGFDYTNHSVEEAFSEMTQDPTVVTKGTFVYDSSAALWTISGKNADDQDIFTGYRLYTEDLEDLGFVMLNPSADYVDGETLEFEITWTSATSYDWVRIDVQPNTAVWGSISGTLSNQTDLTAYVGSEITSGLVPVQADITDIQALIPTQASASNQLADKSFVNSSVSTNTAYFIGTFNSVSELEAYSGTLTNNDYAFVVGTDSQGNTVYNRYKYNADTQQWIFEYSLNNSSFTADQWAAINSSATAAKIAQIETNRQGLANHIADQNNPHAVTKTQVGLGNVDNTADLDKPVSTATQAALNAKQNTLTAGNNITITNNVISAADGTTVTFRTWEANE